MKTAIAEEPVVMAAPQCGRCAKFVENITVEELEGGAVKVIYGCHGEQKSYDIEKWFYDELVREKKSINPVEFAPVPTVVTMKRAADPKDIRIAELEAEVARLTLKCSSQSQRDLGRTLSEELKRNAVPIIPEQQPATATTGSGTEQEHGTGQSGRKPASSPRKKPVTS